MTKPRWLSIGAMAGFLVLAFLLDCIAGRVHLYISRTFQLALPYLFLALLELLFAGAALFLFWWHLVRNDKSRLVGGVASPWVSSSLSSRCQCGQLSLPAPFRIRHSEHLSSI